MISIILHLFLYAMCEDIHDIGSVGFVEIPNVELIDRIYIVKDTRSEIKVIDIGEYPNTGSECISSIPVCEGCRVLYYMHCCMNDVIIAIPLYEGNTNDIYQIHIDKNNGCKGVYKYISLFEDNRIHYSVSRMKQVYPQIENVNTCMTTRKTLHHNRVELYIVWYNTSECSQFQTNEVLRILNTV